MPITKQKKQEIVSEISNLTKDATSLVFVKFDKLTVKDVNALRRGLDKEGAGYKVVKKTLLKRMLETKGFTGEIPVLPGEIALAYGKDSLAPAREIYAFQKTHKDNIAIVGGIYEGVFKTQEEMVALATIPSLDVLRGMFVNIINSPIQRFVIALSEVAKTKAPSS